MVTPRKAKHEISDEEGTVWKQDDKKNTEKESQPCNLWL